MLRIGKDHRGDVTVVHVDGRLDGDGVEALERECRSAGRPLELDLSGLLNADEVGLSYLRASRESGALLAGASPFLRLLLDGERRRTGRRGGAP